MLLATDLQCIKGSRQLFKGVSFEVKPGNILRVEGKNGSGKTTLLRAICGLLKPADGKIFWKSQLISELDSLYHADVAYLSHTNGLKDELSALENLRLFKQLADGKAVTEQIANVLVHLGLKGRENLPIKVLSQGQKRRVAIARLLVCPRPLWLLDEPLASLDSPAFTIMEGMLQAHLTQGGMAVLTTHQPITTPSQSTQYLQLGE